MTRRPWILLAPLVLLALVAPARAADDDQLTKDLATLKAASIDSDTKALLALIKKRTISEETRGKVAKLIKQLGADDFDERESASEELIEMGAAARPQLTVALKDSDLETRKRAKKALDKIGTVDTDAEILPAMARVLASRKAEGLSELILTFLPSIEQVETAAMVARPLALVAKDKNGKADPVLLKALGDKKYPIKRWAAGNALAMSAFKDQKDAVLKLLEDDDVSVRRRVAETIAVEAKAKEESIPALVKILATESNDDVNAAENVLQAIASALAEANEKVGEKAPDRPSDLDAPKARTRWKQEWEAWWKEASAKADLKKVDFDSAGRNEILIGLYGYTNNRKYTGRLVELDKSGKQKWELEDLMNPLYACKTRHDRVLVCESNGAKVVEYDVKSKKAVWTKTGLNGQPIACERLRNGHTFIVTRNQMLEVDREGKIVKHVDRPNYDIVTGGRHRNGTYTLVTSNGTMYRYDASFKQTSSYSTGRYISYPNALKCAYLPDGGLVLPDYSMRKIREFDKDGKQVVELDATYPNAVSKLANGNYVYLSRSGNQGMVEITKDGKQVTTMSIPNNNQGRMQPLFMERK